MVDNFKYLTILVSPKIFKVDQKEKFLLLPEFKKTDEVKSRHSGFIAKKVNSGIVQFEKKLYIWIFFRGEKYFVKTKPLQCSERHCLKTQLQPFWCPFYVSIKIVSITMFIQRYNEIFGKMDTSIFYWLNSFLFLQKQIGKTFRIFIIQSSFIFKGN